MPDLSFNQLRINATQPQWLTNFLETARSLNLPVTSWQPGGIARTIFVVFSYVMQSQDVAISIIAQAGFLDFAATGSVSYTDVNGNTVVVYVTPDPSDPEQNPDGTPGWLDVLASSVYNVQRVWSTYAGGTLALINTSLATYGPFDAGTYHVANTATDAAYANTAILSIPPSTLVGTAVATVANAAGLIRITTTANHGLTTGDIVGVVEVTGVTQLQNPTAWVVTVVNATQFTLDGSAFSGSYTGGGRVFIPTFATFQADVIGSASGSYDANGALAAHTIQDSVTALVGVSVDNYSTWTGSDTENNTSLANKCRLKLQSISVNGPRGAYEFFALSAQTYAPLLTPPQSVSAAITRALVQQDTITGHVTTIIANADGAPGGSDVTAVGLVLNAYCVPLGITSEVYAATDAPVTMVADIYVPAAYVTTANQQLFQAATQVYFRALPVGGLSASPDYANIVPRADVLGMLYEAAKDAAIPVDNVILSLDGSLTDDVQLTVSFTAAEVATIAGGTPTINLIPV